MVVAATQELISGPYAGNGATTVFDYGFKIYAADELIVTRTNADTTLTVLVRTTDYTVTGVGSDGGGTIVLVNADRLPTGATMTIEPDVALSQERPFNTQSSIDFQGIEDSFDKLTSMARQLFGLVQRFPRAAAGTVIGTIQRGTAGQVLQWDASGNVIPGADNADIAAAAGAATAAANAQAAAESAEATAVAAADSLSATVADVNTMTTLWAAVTAYGRTLIASADAAAARVTLGLGTAATVDTGTAEGDVPVLGVGGKLPEAVLPGQGPGSAIAGGYTTISGGTPTLNNPYGISSMDDLGAGLYRYNLSTPRASALDYHVDVSINTEGFPDPRFPYSISEQLTTSFTVRIVNVNSGVVDRTHSFEARSLV